MSKIQIGIDFGITNSDIAIKSDEKISFESIESQKNIHLSLTNIIKNKQEAGYLPTSAIADFIGLRIHRKH